MDDIPFFDTSSFETRGGLFADAFKQHAGVAASVLKGTSSYSDATAVSDASDTDSSKVPNDSLIAASLSDSDGGSSMGQAETTLLSLRRRKAWFGRKDSDIVSSQSDTTILAHKRGKSLDGSFSSPSTDINVVVTDEDSMPATEAKETKQSIRRAQSHNSRVVSETVIDPQTPSSSESSKSASGLSRSAPSSSPLSSSSAPSVSHPPVNVASGSLLATLKSRGAVMAEKPKEAMKKWGVNVNWGAGLRKVDKELDNKVRECVKGDWELDADHGELWGHKDESKDVSRTSFAELRRKVEAREKERALASASGPGTPTLMLDDGEQLRAARSIGTKPIDIPGVSQAPLASLSTAASASDTPRKASPPNNGPAAAPAPFLSPSAPRTTTELHTSTHVVTPPRERELNERQRTPSFSAIPDSLPDVEAAPTVPIRAQPRAATMVIPGIHISHRNDIMALSSEPAAPQTKVNEVPTHAPLSAPTLGGIQSVRRLFRANGLDIKDHEETKPIGLSTPTDSLSSPPPPLPPRKQSAEIDRPGQSPSPVLQTDVPSHSPASHALKQVVEQDAARKPPPLPARRNTPIVVPRTPSSTALIATEDEPSDTTTTSPAGPTMSNPQSGLMVIGDDHDLGRNSSPNILSKNSIKPPLPPRRPTFPLSPDKSE